MAEQPNLLVFASGTPSAGGSGFENLVHAHRGGRLSARIAAVVSNHAQGGVRQRANRLGIPFIHFAGPLTAQNYALIVEETAADFIALSGWLKLVAGLDPTRTVNIHPGPLPDFGGHGMYGARVHARVLDAFRNGEITHSAVSMHFVTEDYDRGPVFFHAPVPIRDDDTPETLGARVLRHEHFFQPLVMQMVISGAIAWNGRDRLPSLTPEQLGLSPMKETN